MTEQLWCLRPAVESLQALLDEGQAGTIDMVS